MVVSEKLVNELGVPKGMNDEIVWDIGKKENEGKEGDTVESQPFN